MPYYSYVIKPYRENFVDTITDEESRIVSEHFEYLKRLLETKELIMAGRTDKGEFGIAIFECDDEQHARRLTENDPAIKSGVFIPKLYRFHIALFRDIK